ncbi:MAG: mechanosensitive ion channel domain-containing protein [Myxococcota bacterium]
MFPEWPAIPPGLDRWLNDAIWVVGVLLLAWLGHAVLFWGLRRAIGLARGGDERFIVALRQPTRWVVLMLALRAAVPGLVENETWALGLQQGLTVGLILVMMWLALSAARAGETAVIKANPIDVPNNLRARRIRTQVGVLRRVASVLIVILGTGLVLMTFPEVRQLGASLLASAGLAGIVLGFAARPVLENLIAGLQLALTAPIRIDDVVVVEGEWGRIEEIHSTFVVVALWDQRRLLLPLTYFIEKPFQNWTRASSELIGPVYLYVDYGLPVDELREELSRIVEGHPLWDGRVAKVQVTDATEQSLQVRVLVSAADAGNTWELRCDVREKLVAFVQRAHPDRLPKVRGDLMRGAV